jgi:hypothetical protein
MSIDELKVKAHTRFPKRETHSVRTVRDLLVALSKANASDEMHASHGAEMLGVVRPTPRGKRKGSGRRFAAELFWPAHDMMKAHLTTKAVEEAMQRNPSDKDLETIRQSGPTETEIAFAMQLFDESNGRPSDTYWRYMREHRENLIQETQKPI